MIKVKQNKNKIYWDEIILAATSQLICQIAVLRKLFIKDLYFINAFFFIFSF